MGWGGGSNFVCMYINTFLLPHGWVAQPEAPINKSTGLVNAITIDIIRNEFTSMVALLEM